MMQFRFYLINQYIDSHLPHLIFGELGYTEIWYNQPHKRVRPHAGKGKMTVADIDVAEEKIFQYFLKEYVCVVKKNPSTSGTSELDYPQPPQMLTLL